MARLPKGHEVLELAKSLLKEVTEVNDFRVCLAVILPLEYGLSTQETAASNRSLTKIL